MVVKAEASASPEKRLFIHLLTRDISLADAFLDLLDNSINSLLAGAASSLRTAEDYVRLLSKKQSKDLAEIRLSITPTKIEIQDNSGGISFESARDFVFRFGRVAGERDKSDRLSVYGVGLKRAIFKIGNKIAIESNHQKGGFSLDLNVQKWETDPRQPWVIDIESRDSVAQADAGTKISISQLYPEVSRRVGDGLFLFELKERIQKTYEFFLSKLVRIFINNEEVTPFGLLIGSNAASDGFVEKGVACSIIAGIGIPDSRGFFVDDKAGWSIFCNGRAVIFADKTALTGWTGPVELPLFQPKHRPFVGLVFFVSADPEMLPWTTTKSAINRESDVWQEARRRMVSVGKQVTTVLDRRYTNDGTGMSRGDVKALGGKETSALNASTLKPQKFEVRKTPEPETIRIQYDAEVRHIDAIRAYLRRRTMSGSDVGRHTFSYFLKNRVGFDE